MSGAKILEVATNRRNQCERYTTLMPQLQRKKGFAEPCPLGTIWMDRSLRTERRNMGSRERHFHISRHPGERTPDQESAMDWEMQAEVR
jgi:hypothetical protein